MLSETQKPENNSFGQEIIRIAEVYKTQKMKKSSKKNFLTEHAKNVKNFVNNKQETAFKSRVKEITKYNMAVQKKTQNEKEQRDKARDGLVKWDAYRVKKEVALKML